MRNQNIIEKLKNEHKEIVSLLTDTYKGNGVASSDWKENFIKARSLFEEHLDHEDQTIYSDTFFNETAFGGYGATAKKFQEEMKDITVAVENFFMKYKESTETKDFNRDYASIVNALEKRISAEEKILFKEFENIKTSA